MKVDNFYKSPMAGFLLCNVDESGDPKYYGYESPAGSWIVMRSVGSITFKYAYGHGNYEGNWLDKANLTYDVPSVIFTDLIT